MSTDLHPAATRYLKELDRALTDLPRERRREIVEDIRSHIQEASRDADGEAQIRTLLNDLGDPDVIASDARERFGITRNRAGALEGIAISALLVGGIVIPALGWVLGVVLLWISRVWSTRDKLIGTFVVPGGLALPLYLSFFASASSSCETSPTGIEISRGGRVETVTESVTLCHSEPFLSTWLGVALVVLLVGLAVATAIYLGRRAWRPAA